MPDDLASLAGADTQPAAQPETGGTDGAMSAPETGDGTGGVSVDSDSPVLPSPQARALESPAGEEELSISTDPAQPAPPDVSKEEAAFPDTSEESHAEDAMDEAKAGALPADGAADTPAAPAQADVAKTLEEAPAEAAPTPEEKTDTPGTVTPPQQTTEEATQGGETDPAGLSSTIGDLAPEVTTNRLPSVGDAAQEAANTAAPVQNEAGNGRAESDASGTADAEMPPPLERFAVEFDNPDDKPLMSIILIDDGSSPVGLDALESFPYPLSFAVDAGAPDAVQKMAQYREAGFEVLALADLPEGAGAQDAEVAMQATLAALPEVVGVMEGTGSGLQSSRAAAEQLAPILLESGHGLVLFPKGLNTAQKLLAREGVPAAAVFRDFDAKGQNATVIRRFLDQAAFKAGQEDAGVVMVGRLRPDTVSALLLWGLQDRADRVALAPISAILRGDT